MPCAWAFFVFVSLDLNESFCGELFGFTLGNLDDYLSAIVKLRSLVK